MVGLLTSTLSMSILGVGGVLWIQLAPSVHPCSHCDVPHDRWSRKLGLCRRPTDHRGCIRLLRIHDVSTRSIINPDLPHHYSASDCRCWPRGPSCSDIETECNPLSPVHGGVHENTSSCKWNLLYSGTRCRILSNPTPSGACGPNCTRSGINPENYP